jgi:hypothetical protein
MFFYDIVLEYEEGGHGRWGAQVTECHITSHQDANVDSSTFMATEAVHIDFSGPQDQLSMVIDPKKWIGPSAQFFEFISYVYL